MKEPFSEKSLSGPFFLIYMYIYILIASLSKCNSQTEASPHSESLLISVVN